MSSYKYASVVQLTEDDPAEKSTLEEGDIRLVAGKHEESYSYSVLAEASKDFVDVGCRVLGVLEADYRMSKSEIVSWAADQDEAVQYAQEATA